MPYRLIVEQFDPVRPKPGGIDTCIRGLIKFARDGEEIRVAGVDAIGDKPLGAWLNYEVGGREFKFMALTRLDHADLRRRIPHSVQLTRGLKRYLPDTDATVVQTHRVNVGNVVLRHFRSTPHVQFMHSSGDANLKLGSVSFFRRFPEYYRFLEQRVVERSRAVIIFSRDGAERLSAISENVNFSPTWYDPTEFFPADGERDPKRRVLWACRIEPAKNPELALDAFSRTPDGFSLTVAGSGTLEPMMRRRAEELGLSGRVTFRGAVPKGDVGALMREHDILLMSSRFEGFSRSIVEALASALPVATTPGGEPNGLVVEGKNGARTFDPDNADELSAAIVRAAGLSASTASKSVVDLSATVIVPELLKK